MRELGWLVSGCVVGLVWGIVMSYSHSLSFAEFLCGNCRKRNEENLRANLKDYTPLTEWTDVELRCAIFDIPCPSLLHFSNAQKAMCLDELLTRERSHEERETDSGREEH